MMQKIDFHTLSLSGKGKSNEDYILCRKISEKTLIAILADGMGGLSHGAEAAKIAAHTILDTITNKMKDCPPEIALQQAFDSADTAIREKCMTLKCKMGTALTAALIIDSSLYYAWQGNVRLYIVRNGEMLLLTTDHVAPCTKGKFLTHCINGNGYRDAIPTMREDLTQIEQIFICSDGFYQSENPENLTDDCSLIHISLERIPSKNCD